MALSSAAVSTKIAALSARSKRVGLIVAALLTVLASLLPLQHVGAVAGNMILFWDPANGGAPAGWCVLTTYDGYFPRGETVANVTAHWGTTYPTASRPYTPTTNTASMTGASTSASSSGGAGTISDVNHTHSIATIGYTSEDNGDKVANPNLPAFRSLQLIIYGSGCGGSFVGSGVPNTIPANAIALFNTSLPASGWTRVSAQDGKFIRANSTVATGGGDTEFTDVTVTGLSATATTAVTRNNLILNANAAPQTHTHSPPSTITCTSGCATPSTSCPLQGSAGSGAAGTSKFRCTATGVLPNYVQPILGAANANTPTLAIDITAMFDADPGTGWVVRSGTGDIYNQKFLRPNSTASMTAQGAANHSITFSGNYGASIGSSLTTLALGTTSALDGHTHTLTGTTNTVSNIPPYFEVVIAEKVSFTLSHYEWYVDSNTADVTDPWPTGGGIDLGVDKQVTAVPAPYKPPDTGDQLRLRVQIAVTGQPLAINTLAFKLQYQPNTTASCTSGGTWNDVDVGGTGTDAWRYGTNSVSDNTTLTAGTSRITPNSTVMELFMKSANSANTNPRAATTSDTIEYDWLIQNNGANGATQYSFRPVEDHNTYITLLGEYNDASPSTSKCPTLVTKPGISQELRHGNFFQDGSEKGFEWAD